jgi:uncharacterized protein
MSIYNINKRYSTEVERSSRVLEVAEAFGIGLDDKEFVVFDNLDLEIEQGDVVYITGQSGSGKSTVLRELALVMSESGLTVSDIDKVVLEDKPLIDQIGKTTQEALTLLSIAGLNDAYLFIRKPCELSDGQRYRFRLAKLIESGTKVWIADEFLAVLDRTTAKVIAFNIQKIARRVGATVLVATTHNDMVQDLAPSLYINKRYREKIEITRTPEGFKDAE